MISVRLAHNRGQSLIEVLVGMVIAVLIISGLVSVVATSVKNSQFSKNQSQATQYANEGLEAVRSIRDINWNNLSTGTYGLLNNSGVWSLSGSFDMPAPGFTRRVTIADVPADAEKKMVTVEVLWTDSSGTHKSKLESYFTRWK